MDIISIFIIAIVVLAIVTVFKGVQTVKQGYEYTVERFGRYRKTLVTGLHIIVT